MRPNAPARAENARPFGAQCTEGLSPAGRIILKNDVPADRAKRRAAQGRDVHRTKLLGDAEIDSGAVGEEDRAAGRARVGEQLLPDRANDRGEILYAEPGESQRTAAVPGNVDEEELRSRREGQGGERKRQIERVGRPGRVAAERHVVAASGRAAEVPVWGSLHKPEAPPPVQTSVAAERADSGETASAVASAVSRKRRRIRFMTVTTVGFICPSPSCRRQLLA